MNSQGYSSLLEEGDAWKKTIVDTFLALIRSVSLATSAMWEVQD